MSSGDERLGDCKRWLYVTTGPAARKHGETPHRARTR